jgi:hypothetical protein
MAEKNVEKEFRDAYASDPVKTVFEEFVGLYERIQALEGRVTELHPEESKMDAVLAALAQLMENQKTKE